MEDKIDKLIRNMMVEDPGSDKHTELGMELIGVLGIKLKTNEFLRVVDKISFISGLLLAMKTEVNELRELVRLPRL